jgi:redox-sensitive bicupin YhaK (pirin superfamily)
MSIKRKLIKAYTPSGHTGFLGPDHIAREVVQGDYSETDPFILLMDDMLDKKNDEPVGGPHPHAGFETVTLLLEGEMGDEAHKMKAGDLQIMTAGSGIVHTETIAKKAKMRLLQLWLNLPKKDRWTTPRLQDISLEHVPKISENGVDIKLYSGSLSGISSPVQNYVPVIIADIQMQANKSAMLHLPASYTTFLYMIDGNMLVGEERKSLDRGQTGWLDKFVEEAESELILAAGQSGARFILYSGQPQGERIIPHGPFIGDAPEDITRLYQDYRTGKMKHISTASEKQRIVW